MTEDRLSNDTVTNDILDNNISIALEKHTILLEKISNNYVPNKDSEHVSNKTPDTSKLNFSN